MPDRVRTRKIFPPVLLCIFSALPAGAQSASGSSAEIRSLQQQVTALTAQIDRTGFLISAVLLFFMAFACLGLWWSARSFRAFRSVGLYLASVGLVLLVDVLDVTRPYENTVIILTSLLIVEMTADALGFRAGRWIWLNRIACAVALLLAWSPLSHLLQRLTIDGSELIVLALTLAGFRRGPARQRLIAAALLFVCIFRAPLDPLVRTHFPMGFHIGGWRWNGGPIAMVIFGSAAVALFVRQLIEDQREKQRLAMELEAGRTMQQVLLGADMPALAGLLFESAYRPASEVGGDFFQILSTPDGSVLAAIGDVSGKGLRAAMTVSAILGALRALSAAAPAELLCALNQTLAGRLDGGFVTCCIARVTPAGALTIANAGHISPYRNGEEVSIHNGLPLGISPDITYSETNLHLAPGDQLTFLSDGVVEAQSAGGELFGFDRTAQISTLSAEAIAAAAQQFGQEDDITVLTLTFAPAEVLHA